MDGRQEHLKACVGEPEAPRTQEIQSQYQVYAAQPQVGDDDFRVVQPDVAHRQARELMDARGELAAAEASGDPRPVAGQNRIREPHRTGRRRGQRGSIRPGIDRRGDLAAIELDRKKHVSIDSRPANLDFAVSIGPIRHAGPSLVQPHSLMRQIEIDIELAEHICSKEAVSSHKYRRQCGFRDHRAPPRNIDAADRKALEFDILALDGRRNTFELALKLNPRRLSPNAFRGAAGQNRSLRAGIQDQSECCAIGERGDEREAVHVLQRDRFVWHRAATRGAARIFRCGCGRSRVGDKRHSDQQRRKQPAAPAGKRPDTLSAPTSGRCLR